jgi:hypothetical protein
VKSTAGTREPVLELPRSSRSGQARSAAVPPWAALIPIAFRPPAGLKAAARQFPDAGAGFMVPGSDEYAR